MTTSEVSKLFDVSTSDQASLKFVNLLQDCSDNGIHYISMIVGPFIYNHVLLISGKSGTMKSDQKNDREDNWVYRYIENIVMSIVFKDTKHSLLLDFSKKLIGRLESGFYDYVDSWLLSKDDFVEKSTYLRERLSSLVSLLYESMNNDKFILDGMNKNHFTMEILLDYIEDIISDIQSTERQVNGNLQNDLELLLVSHHDPIFNWISKLKKNDEAWDEGRMELNDDIQWLDLMISASSEENSPESKLMSDMMNREYKWNESKYMNVLSYLVSEAKKKEKQRYVQEKMTKFAYIQTSLIQFIVDDILDGFNEYMDVYIVSHKEFKNMVFDEKINDEHINVIFKIIREFMWHRDAKHFQFVTNWIKKEDNMMSSSSEKSINGGTGGKNTFTSSHVSMVYRYDLYISFMKYCVSLVEWFNLFPYYHFSDVPSEKSDVYAVDYSCISLFERMYDIVCDERRSNDKFLQDINEEMSPMGRIIYESFNKHTKRRGRDGTHDKINNQSSEYSGMSTMNIDQLPLNQRRSTMLMLFSYTHDILMSDRYKSVSVTNDGKILNSMYWIGHMENRQLKLIHATPSQKVFIIFLQLTLHH